MKKNFLEKLLDLIYDYIDYIIMIVIIVLVVGVIAWRLDLIFIDNGTSSQPPIEEVEEETEDELNEVEGEPDPASDRDESEEPESEDNEELEGDIGMEVEIVIPSGTMPPGIGNILLGNNLIDDSSEFLNAVQDQNLETGLKAGVYIVPTNSNINEILQILTN